MAPAHLSLAPPQDPNARQRRKGSLKTAPSAIRFGTL